MDELRLHWQLVPGEAHGLARQGLRHAGQLEHHAPGLDHGHPALRRALARPHAGLGGLLRVGLVREDVDPDLAAALDLAGHRDTGRFDLAVRHPAALERLQPVLAELHARPALGVPAHAPALLLAPLDSLRLQHQSLPWGAPPWESPRPPRPPPPGPRPPPPGPRPPPPGPTACGASSSVRSCAKPLGMISPLLIQTLTPMRPNVVRAS